jgi:hypothetical protein
VDSSSSSSSPPPLPPSVYSDATNLREVWSPAPDHSKAFLTIGIVSAPWCIVGGVIKIDYKQ